ncbi:hypothetical protein JCM8208_002012 [Rhodotorula glutinis]
MDHLTAATSWSYAHPVHAALASLVLAALGTFLYTLTVTLVRPHTTSLRELPGPASGLPYEFYRQHAELVAPLLADAFNNLWDEGKLPTSMASPNVRLLLKQATADPTYRPISLRECDYRILARILVQRINPVLEYALPANQVGFVPGRRSADAGLHLRLLLEEISTLDLPHAPLLSLDQEKAYDRVAHGWGDPFSCATWVLSFQPFVDALTRRGIALTLHSPLATFRADILTAVAFADDTNVAIESLSVALPRLEHVRGDWYAASNGKINLEKTEVLALGAAARDDPCASQVRFVGDDGSTPKWAGYPLAVGPPPLAFWDAELEKMRRRAGALGGAYSSLRARTLVANSFILSRSLHILLFAPPPLSFVEGARKILVDYVWGSLNAYHSVAGVKLFLPVKSGGLGLLDPALFVYAGVLRFLDHLLAFSNTLWIDLAYRSFHRHASSSFAHPDFSACSAALPPSVWSLLRLAAKPKSLKHSYWSSVADVVGKIRKIRPSLVQVDTKVLARSTTPPSSLLLFPPSLFTDIPSLSKIPSIASLHFYSPARHAADPRPGLFSLPLDVLKIKNQALKSGSTCARRDWLRLILPRTDLAYLLPLGSPAAPDILVDASLALGHAAPLEAAWAACRAKGISAREGDMLWRILHGALTTRHALAVRSQGTIPADCLLCGAPDDSLVHGLFDCPHSAAYWDNVRVGLAGDDPLMSAATFDARELLLGLPTLQALSDAAEVPRLRALVGTTLRTLVDARLARIRKEAPALSTASPEGFEGLTCC